MLTNCLLKLNVYVSMKPKLRSCGVLEQIDSNYIAWQTLLYHHWQQTAGFKPIFESIAKAAVLKLPMLQCDVIMTRDEDMTLAGIMSRVLIYVVPPLLKDTLAKGHLSNKDRMIWQVLWMPLILSLTKGHLSNEDRIIWQKGCRY